MAFLNLSETKKQGVCLLLSLCFAGIMLPAESKNVTFKLPSSDKLTDGDTPLSAADKTPAQKVKLAPLSLHDDAPTQTGENESNDGLLKSSVSQNEFKAKNKAGSGDKNAVATGANESVIDKKKLADKLKGKKAKQAPDVGPIALHETEDEVMAKVDTTLDAEKRQMSELWQCTIERNPDIQFVIQKLQPNSDANHAMASTMKILTMSICGAMNMAPFMLPGGAGQANPAAMMGMGSGSNLIQGLFQDKSEKNAKKQAISQEQATILYKIVRDTADKLVVCYRDYKKEQTSVGRANADWTDLKSMVAEARQGQDAAKQVEMEYTLRKAKRDIDEKLEQARLYRQQLTDLAGIDAVAKLDKDMLEEHAAVEMLTGTNGETVKPAGLPGAKTDGPFVNPLMQMAAQPPSKPAQAAQAEQTTATVQPIPAQTKIEQTAAAAPTATVEQTATAEPQAEAPAKKIASARLKHNNKRKALQQPLAPPLETAAGPGTVTQ